jgi:hypothetical protein
MSKTGNIDYTSGKKDDRVNSFTNILKEMLGAFLAVLIVISILVLMWPSLSKSPADITGAQAIFSILGGWGGIAIGYYFGRIPAEKSADKASAEADQARQEKDYSVRDINRTKIETHAILQDNEQFLRKTRFFLQDLVQTKGITIPPSIVDLERELDKQIETIQNQKVKITQ